MCRSASLWPNDIPYGDLGHCLAARWHQGIIWTIAVLSLGTNEVWLDSKGNELTHWGQVTYICIGKLAIISSDNGLSPGWCQAIIWTNAGILLIRTLGTTLSEILSEIHIFSFKKMHLKMLSAKWQQFCLNLDMWKGHQVHLYKQWNQYHYWPRFR